MGFQAFGFRVCGFGVGALGLGFEAWGLRLRGVRVWGLVFGVVFLGLLETFLTALSASMSFERASKFYATLRFLVGVVRAASSPTGFFDWAFK